MNTKEYCHGNAISTIKGSTNWGEPAKQWVFVVESYQEIETATIMIKKHVLTDRIDDYEREGFKVLRQFRDKYLVEQWFGLKLSTFQKISSALSTYYLEKI